MKGIYNMIDAPIRLRPLHDAQVWLLLCLFFIATALPFAWYTVVLWASAFALIALWQGVRFSFVVISLALAFALSISIWLLNMWYHPSHVSAADAQLKANQTALKVWSLTWVALLSARMMVLRDVITFALQRGWLSMQIAYAMLVGLGSIELLRGEVQRINLSAKLRNLTGFQRFLQWIPLLIFGLRHAQRGAMSLRARGLATQKTFYYNYQPTKKQSLRFAFLSVMLIGLAWF
ncbi:MAG: hypothetical protein ACRCV6_00805 [Formosimonas sp.]